MRGLPAVVNRNHGVKGSLLIFSAVAWSPVSSTGMLLGIDFDNTLVTYDQLFRVVALAGGLIDPDFAGTKQEIRDRIRLLPDGELAWQRLQGFVYGKGIA